MGRKQAAENEPIRRRGEALEHAILTAAWDALLEDGYAAFSYEAVAERAGTSRPVLYRRWPDRTALVLATLQSFWRAHPMTIPDTGDLRTDAIRLLRAANTSRVRVMTKITADLVTFLRDAGVSLNELRRLLHPGEDEPFETMVARAVRRGELPVARRSARLVSLPLLLFRNEVFMTMRAVPEAVIVEIVDDLWLPLLRAPKSRRR
ncbi:MAG TPA: TetR/AcrR family transcriptional regulator [Polyangiaceae bacterium]